MKKGIVSPFYLMPGKSMCSRKENVEGCLCSKRSEKSTTAILPICHPWLITCSIQQRWSERDLNESRLATLQFYLRRNTWNPHEQSHEISHGGDQEQKWTHLSSVLGRLETGALNLKTRQVTLKKDKKRLDCIFGNFYQVSTTVMVSSREGTKKITLQ